MAESIIPLTTASSGQQIHTANASDVSGAIGEHDALSILRNVATEDPVMGKEMASPLVGTAATQKIESSYLSFSIGGYNSDEGDDERNVVTSDNMQPSYDEKSTIALKPTIQSTRYHPEFMFCGECTSCSTSPPPPLSSMPFSTKFKKKKKGNTMVFLSPTEAADYDLANKKTSKNLHHRSTLLITNLTCPSQILILNSVLSQIQPKITKILTNLSNPDPTLSKLVHIDHDPLLLPITTIQTALRDMGYNTIIQRDGGTEGLLFKHEGLCRSHLFVKGICCASEVPSVTKILKSKPGVKKVSVNITTKMVYVEHDPFQVPIQVLANELNLQGFVAVVRRDGAAKEYMPKADGDDNAIVDTKGRSAFVLKQASDTGRNGENGNIARRVNEQDVGNIQRILSNIHGVARIGINLKEGMVYVDHETTECSAGDCQVALRCGNYDCTVRTDAAVEIESLRTELLLKRQGKGGRQKARFSKFVESTILIPGMTTPGDLSKLERAFLQKFTSKQVRAFYPHIPSRTIKVEHNPRLISASTITEMLRLVVGCLDVVVHVDGAVEGLALPFTEHDPRKGGMSSEDDNETWTLFGGLHVNVLFSGFFWVLSMMSFIRPGWENLKYFGLFSVVFGIPPVAAKAWRTICRCQFDANCMMVVAALGSLALQEYDEAASVAFLFAVSEWLEARATSRARKALNAIVNLRPDHANFINQATGEITIIPASNLTVGSHVSVGTGDKIPADGIVVEGSSSVDESSLTGEARPIFKKAEDSVAGGSINIGSTRLVIKTISTVNDSAVSRLIRLVEEAQANRSPTEKLIDSFAKRYTPIVVTIAAFMCTIPWIWGREVGRYWTLNGLIIIVIACPCALTISTPVTYAAGLASTAQKGIIVKGGAKLESLGRVRKVVFDKTGTLTEGKFKLVHLDTIGEHKTRIEVLELLALIEAPSSHPLSATLVDAAKKEGVGIPKDVHVKDHSILMGEGVTAKIGEQNVYVGNSRLFQRLGMYDSIETTHKTEAKNWSSVGASVGFIGIENIGIIGIFCVSDAVRNEAKSVVKSLQDEGIEVIMLTGDGRGAAQAVAREVGIPDSSVHSQLLPEDKLHFIRRMKCVRSSKACTPCSKKDLVLMCGDGVNDAPALAVADVGVAMGEGAALSMEISDVTLMDSNLSKLLFSIKMGKRVILTIQENIILSLLTKLVVVGLTFFGDMTLLWAIASDVGVMLIVTLNGMKLLPRGKGNFDLESEQLVLPKRKMRKTGVAKYDEIPAETSRSASLPDIL